MLFHVIPRPSPQRTEVNPVPTSRPPLMPRYHYSKLVNTPTNGNTETTTAIPLRTSASHQREFIPIPITRENGTTISTLPPPSRSVPFTYLSEDEGTPMTNTSFISECRLKTRLFHTGLLCRSPSPEFEILPTSAVELVPSIESDLTGLDQRWTAG